MSGMDRLTDELLEAYASGKWKSYERDNIAMARELIAHRRASQAAAWNDAIEAAEAAYAQGFAAIRALRRAAPTEGEA